MRQKGENVELTGCLTFDDAFIESREIVADDGTAMAVLDLKFPKRHHIFAPLVAATAINQNAELPALLRQAIENNAEGLIYNRDTVRVLLAKINNAGC